MTKVQAILHLYRTGRISEDKTIELSSSKGLTDSEIDFIKIEIEKMKNPIPDDYCEEE